MGVKRLTAVQLRVLAYLARGWELERVPPFKNDSCYRLRSQRLYISVRGDTVRGLEWKGYIVEQFDLLSDVRLGTFHLTPKAEGLKYPEVADPMQGDLGV